MDEKPIQMVGSSVGFQRVFSDIVGQNIRVYQSGRSNIETENLGPEEAAAVHYVFGQLTDGIARVSPRIAGNITKQQNLALKFAEVAKAKMPTIKSISYPSQSSGLAVLPLIPQWFNYEATATSSNPSYTSYNDNTWDIDVTAGTAAYIMGDGTNEYKTKPTADQKIEIIVFDRGLIEVGTTPKVDQWRLYSQNETKYGPYTENTLFDQPIDPERPIYQHDTPMGALILTHDFGMQWKFMPRFTGKVTMPLVGLAISEHGWAEDVKYIS